MKLRKVSASSVEMLRAKVAAEYGSMDSVVGPIRHIETSNMLGIGKTTSYECSVDVTDQPRKFLGIGKSRERVISLITDEEPTPPTSELTGVQTSTVPPVAARTQFQETLAQLEDELSPSGTPRAAGPRISAKRGDRVPAPATKPGDILVVAGVSTDALQIAHQFSAHYGGSKICTAGELATGIDSLVDRRSVLAARAAATDEGRFVIVAFGIFPGRDYTEELQMLDATQVWAAVDASRKTDDTRVWVALLDEAVDVDALAVIGTTATQTPISVNDLGVPIGWVEDEPSFSPALSAATAGIVLD